MPRYRTFLKISRYGLFQVWLIRADERYAPQLKKKLNSSFWQQEQADAGRNSLRLYLDINESGGGERLQIKVAKAQKVADFFRRCFRGQGKREFNSSRNLLRLGLKCPDPVGYGINLVPWSRFDSIFISRHLSGAVTARHQLKDLKEKADRERLIGAAARDLAVMLKNNLFHRDAHFGNILLDSTRNDGLYWIDNDLQKISSEDRERMIDLLMRRIATKKYASQELILQMDEVEWMRQVLMRHLAAM